MSELKPCPSCWSTKVYVVRSLTNVTAEANYPKAQCLDCGCLGPFAKTSDEAVRAWNAIPRKVPPNKTLRDEFAMAALTGLLAGLESDGHLAHDDAAQFAYDRADAMMKEREKADD